MRATEGRFLPLPAGTAHQRLPPTPPAEQGSTASAPAPEGNHAGASAPVSAPSHCAPGAQPKVRKPYTITKQRERWTDKEHHKFLEALKLFGRAWRRIEEHIGTKTAIQIRSHAQKFFTKLEREGSLDGSVYSEEFNIPPPRLKRKPAHPYPRKAVVDPTQSSISTAANTSGSDAVSDIQQNKPGQQARPVVANGFEHPGIISSTLASTKNASASSSPSPHSSALEDDKRTLRLFGKTVNQALNRQTIAQIKHSLGAQEPVLPKASAGLVGQLVSTELTLAEQPSACKSSAVQLAASARDSAQDVAEASHRAWQESEKWVARAAELQHAAHVMAHMPTANHMSTHVRPVITDELPASKRAAAAPPRSAVPIPPPPPPYPFLPELARDVPLNMPLPPNTASADYPQFSTFDYYASRSAHHCHQGCTHPAHSLPLNAFGPWGYPPSVPALWPPQHHSDATAAAAAAAAIAATSAWYAMHGGNLPRSYPYPPASTPMPHFDPRMRMPETTLRAPSPAPIAPMATTAAITTVTSAVPTPAHSYGLTLSLPSSPLPPSAVLRAERASKLRELKARRSSGGLSTMGEVADDTQGRNAVTAATPPLTTTRDQRTASVFVPTDLKLVRDMADAGVPALARAHGIVAVVLSAEGNAAADQKGTNNSNSNRSSSPSSAVLNGGSDNQHGSDGSGSGSDEANHNNNVKSLSSRSSAANASLDNSGPGWTSSDEDDTREPNRSGSGSDSKELDQSPKVQRDGSDESLLSKQAASSPQAVHPSLIRQRSFHDLHEAEQQRSKVARTELTLLPGSGVPSAEGRMAFNMLFQQSPLPQSFPTRDNLSPPFTMPVNHAATAVRNLPFAAGYSHGTHLMLASPTEGYALPVQRPVPEVPHLMLAQDHHDGLTVNPTAGPCIAHVGEPMQLSPSNRPRTQGALDLMLQQPASAASVAAQQRLTALCRSSSEGNILSLNALSGGVFPASGFIPYRNNYPAYASNSAIVHNSGCFGAVVSSPLAPMLALRRPSACGCDNLRTCNECLSSTKQLECECHVVTAAEG